MTLLCLDLGSSKVGCVALDDKTVLGAATIPVDPANIGPTVAAVLAALDACGASAVVVEWSARPYTPKNATPQAMASIMFHREVMVRLLDRVEQACEARGTPVTRIAAVTWRARIGVRRKRRAGAEGFRERAWVRMNPRRDTTDRRVRVRVAELLGEEALELTDVHQHDAAGVGLGAQMGAPASEATREKRAKGEPQPRRVRKHGSRYMRSGHPSDAAFEALMAARASAHS